MLQTHLTLAKKNYSQKRTRSRMQKVKLRLLKTSQNMTRTRISLIQSPIQLSKKEKTTTAVVEVAIEATEATTVEVAVEDSEADAVATITTLVMGTTSEEVATSTEEIIEEDTVAEDLVGTRITVVDKAGTRTEEEDMTEMWVKTPTSQGRPSTLTH